MAEKARSIERSAWINNRTYAKWFNQLYSVAISTFDWKNLPDSVDARYIEHILFWNQYAVYFDDPVMGNLVLPCMINGRLNVYNIPTMRAAFANNGYFNNKLNEENSVVLFDNYARVAIAPDIKMYAERLYNIDRTIDINVNAQKTPILLQANEKEQLTIKNVYMKWEGNMPVIYGYKGQPIDMSVLKTDAPFVADKLFTLKRQTLMEVLTFLGVESNTSDKAERLVTDEIQSNMGLTEAMRNNRLKARQQAAEKINRMFGTNIEVSFNSKLTLARIMEGSEENGPVYNLDPQPVPGSVE